MRIVSSTARVLEERLQIIHCISISTLPHCEAACLRNHIVICSTLIQISTRSGGSGPITLKIYRPFIFVIQDWKNNIPLFIGNIVNPTNEEPASVKNNKMKTYQ